MLSPIGPPQAHAVEIEPPRLDVYARGNTGVPYFVTREGPKAGPHLLVNSAIHGNEIATAAAVDRLIRLDIPLQGGRVTFGFANWEACTRFDPQAPFRFRFVEEDMNRVWDEETLDGPRQSAELARAREMRPLIDTADVLLDLHTMQDPGRPLALTGATEKSIGLARRLGTPSLIVIDSGHPSGRRLRDYGPFSDDSRQPAALLVECGQHWAADAVAVGVDVALRLMILMGLIRRDWAVDHLLPRPLSQRQILVTDVLVVSDPTFQLVRPFAPLEVISKAGTPVAWEAGRVITTPYDNCVLIMPARRVLPGQTACRLGRFADG